MGTKGATNESDLSKQIGEYIFADSVENDKKDGKIKEN
jgi:hypothetical protein